MNPKVYFLIFILFSLYSDVYTLRPHTDCMCTKEGYTCLISRYNFVGVVEVTGSSETCPDETKNCYDIHVLESFNENIEADSIKTIETDQECGPRLSGNYIVSGDIKENEHSFFVSHCGNKRILRQINGPEDPKVNEYRQHYEDCITKMQNFKL